MIGFSRRVIWYVGVSFLGAAFGAMLAHAGMPDGISRGVAIVSAILLAGLLDPNE